MMTLNSETLSVMRPSTSDATITLKSTVAWMATASVGWITDVDPAMGTGTNTAKAITLTYTANMGAERTGTVTFTETTAGVNPKISVTLTVTQGPAIPDGPIPITHLEQLYAIRYDRNGDGTVDNKGDLATTTLAGEAYAAAFPGVVSANAYTGYKLENNLNFSNTEDYLNETTAATNQPKWTSGVGWAPIGPNSTLPFTGMFDGGGHTISNLYIISSSINIGLFGYVSRSTIQNVGLMSPNVTGTAVSDRVGGLVGYQLMSTISNCYVSGGSSKTGLGGSNGAGGLVGLQRSGPISNCYVSGGSSTAGNFAGAGGLVGQQLGGEIIACYVKGRSSTAVNLGRAGGLVGWQQGGEIRACYVSNITATGGNSLGSLVGEQDGTIIASYAGGKDYMISIRGTGSSGMVTNSYYQAATTQDGNDATDDVGTRTETELKMPTNANAYNSGSIYENWDLNLDSNDATRDPWDFGTTTSQYPVLKIDVDLDGSVDDDDITAQRATEE